MPRCEKAIERLCKLDKEGRATTSFPQVSPHDLRHRAASLAISAGANVKAVQTMLGHASAAMTLDTYADLFPDDQSSPTRWTASGHRRWKHVPSLCLPAPDADTTKPPRSCSIAGERGSRGSGARENRTPDLLDANESRYQLRHSPG